MKILEDDCQAGGTIQELKLSSKIAPAIGKWNRAIEPVTTTVSKVTEVLTWIR
ncbi:hypothetical protein [Armatimonas sp.]|uniref:hypothetical protein n=1 Tax=Armatimonas sp. TaxID=1872638 RepID=UPI00286A858B|nr:hypothetical protein [Armatimonas sp.]